MKQVMDIEVAKEFLTKILKDFQAYTKSPFTLSGDKGHKRALHFLQKIDKNNYQTSLDLIAAIYYDPNYKQGSELRKRLRTGFLTVLGFQENDINERAKQLADKSSSESSEKTFIETAKKELLNEQVKHKAPLDEDGIELH